MPTARTGDGVCPRGRSAGSSSLLQALPKRVASFFRLDAAAAVHSPGDLRLVSYFGPPGLVSSGQGSVAFGGNNMIQRHGFCRFMASSSKMAPDLDLTIAGPGGAEVANPKGQKPMALLKLLEADTTLSDDTVLMMVDA